MLQLLPWSLPKPHAVFRQALGCVGGLLLIAAPAVAQRAKSPAKKPAVKLMTHKVAQPVAAAAPVPVFALAAAERQTIEEWLTKARQNRSLAARLKLLSGNLLTSPYLSHSLIGSPTEPEQFVARLDGFDCVTFLETVLALNGATSADDFTQRLRDWRYRSGTVAYNSRLHYTTDWHQLHLADGRLLDLTHGPDTVEIHKTLTMVPGRPAQAAHFRYFPKAKLETVSQLCQDGDLIYFVSGRKALDTNHVGMLFRAGGQVLLRHASRSHQQVVEQPLADFVNANQMIGFILARPTGR